jgi:hypothetical protein
MARTKVLKIIGKTAHGKLVVAGLGRLYYETGLPLSFIFDKCESAGLQVAWLPLVAEFKENGMKNERILHLLSEHIFESYGKEYRDKVIEIISHVIQR